MSDFDNNGFNTGNGTNNQPHPDYYQPSGSGENNAANENGNKYTYYTPPKREDVNNTQNSTYHYSYSNVQNEPNQSNYTPEQNHNDGKPPKKSKAAKIIVIVLVVCLVVAVAGIVASVAGGGVDIKGKESTTQSQASDEDAAKVSESDEAPLKDSGNNLTVAGVADKVMDSCVGITVYSQQADAYNYFYGYSQGGSSDGNSMMSGEGSGVLMSEQNGKTYILTCAHVISEGDSFKVTLNNGDEVDASLVGFDSQTDIGVLAINETGLAIADFADTKNLVVGEQVVAIGCPGGLEFMNSLTSGYISALARPISSTIGYDNECIQIDAAINPGNSGGALFNMQGQVIGINSSKIAATEYEGMGFAVPTSTAVATANSLIKIGYVEGRAKLGIQYNPITSFNNANAVIQALAEKGFKDAQGAMVINSVSDDSDLKNKDIKQYDMIVAVNGETMTSTDIMTSVLADSKPGDTIKLTIARIENNEIRTFEVDCKLIESKG